MGGLLHTHLVLRSGTRGTRRCVRVDVRTEEDFVFFFNGVCVSFFFGLGGGETLECEYGRALEAPTICPRKAETMPVPDLERERRGEEVNERVRTRRTGLDS